MSKSLCKCRPWSYAILWEDGDNLMCECGCGKTQRLFISKQWFAFNAQENSGDEE
tara:strand:+ start:2609 stop:2773 length:165 start_codon:yes stop_codon:yes gene_type:complete